MGSFHSYVSVSDDNNPNKYIIVVYSTADINDIITVHINWHTYLETIVHKYKFVATTMKHSIVGGKNHKP